MLDGLKSDFDDKTKSKAQRLRAVLFKYWEHGHQGYDEFNYFYDHLMEKIITHYKDKLDWYGDFTFSNYGIMRGHVPILFHKRW